MREDVVDTLVSSGRDLSKRQWEWIAGLGKEAVPALVRVLRDDSLRPDDAPGDGMAPVHAARLLAAIEADEAIPELLSTLEGTDPFDPIHRCCVETLQEFGSAVIDPALEALESARGEHRRGLCDVIARAGIRDERVFAVLLGTLDEELEAAAMNLTDYGDARALPYLREALDAYEVQEAPEPLANTSPMELAIAIEQLGGRLTQAQQDKCAHASDVGRRALLFSPEELPATSDAVDPGRDPDRHRNPACHERCWCGSGKKRKNCHTPSAAAG